ncbi:MAG: penicillin acylase family protein [Mariniphaga sp.]|nr:penicillin acylase family protein [Mariniphaga sp.]
MVLFHDYPADVYRQLFGNLPATAELLAQSLNNTLTVLEAERGKEWDNWQWWKINGLTLNHLLNIQALNHPRIKVGGSGDSPNAIRGSLAPSWRMVVSLGDTIQAWGIYPGGQTGNPATRGYNLFVNDFAQGNYYTLKLYPSLESAAKENKNILILKPK